LRTLGITPTDPVFIQSFEIAPLQRLKQRSGGFKLVQLVAPIGGPADEPAMRYAEMVTPTGLAEITKYADAVGAHIGLVLTPEGAPTSLVADATAAGLAVHAWTVRPENDFLPVALRTSDDPKGKGCGDVRLAEMLKAAGVAGVFSDAALKGRNCP
ncbi:MAG TPA: glycerophosphodiester phosphodiesterase family protein, partial [Erythrobacter sp.]|nr:glycerophosphodiester phosphodiesterase family protein [Erythrobacter sp.]